MFVRLLWTWVASQLASAVHCSVPLQPRRPALSAKPLLTVTEHGPWIVFLKEEHSHADFDSHFSRHLQSRGAGSPGSPASPKISHRYERALHGLVVHGIRHDELMALPSVERAVEDGIREVMDDLSWGQDRIDQPDLPLDEHYLPDYDGTGVDVYILDTGLDTNHAEFKGRGAPVKTVYDAYAANKEKPPHDNDHQGHGTHVAGTIGGKNVGVAKGAALLSVRILNEVGQGTVSDIIGAIDFIMRHRRPNNPTVMSMSLGGACQPNDCTQDPLVLAVQALAVSGVIVSVAAGNSACNACTGSPNSAPDAITTAASTRDDEIAFFSNFGQCVDIFAPGHEIVSACANVVCGAEDQYLELSGTSMACPHVTGVIAQLLQRFPSANSDEISKYLTCDASRNRVRLDTRDTLSRNLLLQTPKESTIYDEEYCRVDDDCPQDCNGHGVCMPRHAQIDTLVDGNSKSSLSEAQVACQCDYGWYGNSCSYTADPQCPVEKGHNLKLYLYDAVGDGWAYATYSISDLSDGSIVAGAMDSMAYGTEVHHTYCLSDGCYKYEVSKGQLPGENEWKMCGIKGGAPFSGEFCIRSGHCLFQCPDGNFVDVTMEDTLGQGWNGAYYEIYTPDGKQTFGGGLLNGEAAVHTLCLPKGCSYMMMQSTATSSTNGDMSYDICGHKGSAKTVTEVCIEDDGSCRTPDPLYGFDCPVANTATAMYLFDRGGDGWGGAEYSLAAGTVALASGTLGGGYADSTPICLADGCYVFKVTSGSHDKEIFWNMCGHRGVAPFEAQLCVEKEFGFCYGLSGCPALKSYLHHSDAHFYFLYHALEGGGYELDAAGDLHGVHELCGLALAEGCHKLAVGSGKHILADEDEHFSICGVEGSVPASGDVCVTLASDGTTSCAPDIHPVLCSSREKPHLFAMADQGGDGWGGYYFEIRDSKGKRIYKDTLSKGSFDATGMCFPEGCYELSFSGKGAARDVEEIVWVMCGVVGPAVQSIQFCVTEFGCEFVTPESSGDYYYYYYSGGHDSGTTGGGDDYLDDDFPVDFGTTDHPTPHPTERIIGLPTISQMPTARPTMGPTTPHAGTISQAPSKAPSSAPSLAPITVKPSVAPTLPFGMLTTAINVTVRIKFDTAGEASPLKANYKFIADAIGKVLDKYSGDVMIYEIIALPVVARPYFDRVSDGTLRSLSSEEEASVAKKSIEGVAALKRMRSSVVDTHIRLYENSDISFESRELVDIFGDVFVTVRITLRVSNADNSLDRSAWDLKETVDTALLFAEVDGSLHRKISRSLSDQMTDKPSGILSLKLLGIGVDTKTIPRFDGTQYAVKPKTLEFDDDDLFDDDVFGDEIPDASAESVDTAAITARTNIALGVVTSICTFIFVLSVVMLCMYRVSGNKMKFTLESLISRDDPVSSPMHTIGGSGGNSTQRGGGSRGPGSRVQGSNESVTVVFNETYESVDV